VEQGLILAQLERGFRGPSWHGPSLCEALAGVSEAQASRRPLPGAHSIAELAAHAGAWKRIVADWARGGSWTQVPPSEDWPEPGPWSERLALLEQAHASLVAEVEGLDAAALARRVGETSLAEALFGVVHHDLYHAGQILLLRRATGSSPAPVS
jgi:uncharacterized damage-inducible protein DinB